MPIGEVFIMKFFQKFCKVLKPTVCLSLVVVLMFAFCGCKNERIVKKASKGLNNYTITATLCSEEMKVCASEVVDYINASNDELSFMCFNLYGTAFSEDAKVLPYTALNVNKCFPNGMSYGDVIIDSVRVNKQNANYSIVGCDNNALQVDFGFALKPNERVEVEIQFTLILANTTHRLGFFNNEINLGNWYPIVAVYENGAFDLTPYYSSGDPFYSECANYDVTFYHQDSLIVSHTGELVEKTVEAGVACERYKALAVRDFAMCLSSDFQEQESTVGDTLLRVFCDKDDSQVAFYLEVAVKTVELFNRLFGEYPYKTLDVVFTNFLHGGMEYPNLVYIANDIEDKNTVIKVIVHEIAHQWWYGVVGNNEITTAWFDESMAEYSTVLFFENYPEYAIKREEMVGDAVQDYMLYIDVVESVDMQTKRSMQLALNEYSSEYEYVYMVYVKGVVFVNELRKVLGDDIFFKCVRKLYKENMFGIMTKEKFINAFTEGSGLDIEHFVEGWLTGQTNIE